MQGVAQAYRDFIAYFTKGPNHTGKALLLVLLGAGVLLFLGWLRLVRRKKWQAAVMAVLALLLPLAINLVDVGVPGTINTLMSHPMQMMVPFALALAERGGGPKWWENLVRFGAWAAAGPVCWLSRAVCDATSAGVA